MKKFRLVVLLLALLPILATAATKRALVIGVSEYRDTRWMKPRISADRDIDYVLGILKTSGFASSNIRILKNMQATKARIVDAMKSLAAESNKGDIIYIHFSGHGQLMTDINGDENPDVLGVRWDESWVPYDASYEYDNYDHGELHLCDDEVGLLLTQIRRKIGQQGEMLVIVDACYSGDSTKGNDDATDEEDEYYNMVGDTLSYSCPLPVTRGSKKNFIIPTHGKQKKTTKIPESWITVSACEPHQLNNEMFDNSGKRIGILTYGLYSMTSVLPTISNTSFETELSGFIKKHQGTRSRVIQRPLITGQKDTHNINRVFRK